MPAVRQRSIVEGATFQAALRSNYRWWARLGNVSLVQFLGHGSRGMEMLASLRRPVFPKGVCRQCGCTFADPCIRAGGDCCAWTDASETRCTFCAPARARRSRR